MRTPDPEIPAEEPLYRCISVDDVEEERVKEGAVDPDGSSVSRGAHCEPNSISPRGKGSRGSANTGLAVTTAKALPAHVTTDGTKVAYETFAVDLPEPEDKAHAEIRTGRLPGGDGPEAPDRPNHHKPKSKVLREALKVRIAQAMTIFRRPT